MPDRYPDQGPASIPTAYTELSPAAFAVWLRLMVEPQETLQGGRGAIAKVLRYSERRSNEVLRELSRKGYISFITNGPGRFTEVIIERRALISARSGFVRLSNMLAQMQPCDPSVCGRDDQAENSIQSLLPMGSVYLPNGLGLVTQGVGSELPTCPAGYHIGACNRALSSDDEPEQGGLMAIVHESRLIRRKFVSPGTYSSTPPAPTRNEVQERYRRKADQEKQKRKAERSEARQRREERHKIKGTDPNSIDWSKVDQRGHLVISFEPTVRQRQRLTVILQRKPRDPERKRLMSKLGTEFGRIYSRYRRQAERRNGRSYSNYEVMKGELGYASEAGMWCIIKGVTPRQVLEYWDRNIRQFADGSMVLPPLSFLRYPANIDRVACSVLGDDKKHRKAQPDAPAPGRSESVKRNSWSEIEGLDTRLRPALNAAGFDTTQFNDRYLMGIQYNAMSIAQGKRIFMGESRAKKMAVWAAENLYAD